MSYTQDTFEGLDGYDADAKLLEVIEQHRGQLEELRAYVGNLDHGNVMVENIHWLLRDAATILGQAEVETRGLLAESDTGEAV